MGNKLSHCSSCSHTTHATDSKVKPNSNSLKIGYMKEDDIILKVDTGHRQLQNTFMNAKPYHNQWRESLQSVADPSSSEFAKVRI